MKNLFKIIPAVLSCFLSIDLHASPYDEDRLILNANNVFFSPTGRFYNVEDSSRKGEPVNGNRFFDHTEGWLCASDSLVWGIDVRYPGELVVSPVLAVPDFGRGRIVEVHIGNQKRAFQLKPTGGEDLYGRQKPLVFNIERSGRYRIAMCMQRSVPAGESAKIKGLAISGRAAKEAAPVVLRWRPAAVHCGFSCSEHPDDIEMAIFEIIVKCPEAFAYFPITSPFGYFGSTWIPETQKFGGINFSLWSFSAKSNPPSVERFSHLIAVGEGLHIDGFNHEGTGCKARGVNPYANISGTRQVLALKKIPGNPYDMYYGYYWNPNQRRWKLYGCGKKFNDRPLTYLKTGAFIEVPGPPKVQRSNHVLRRIIFRGWMRDKGGKWHAVDRMKPNGRLGDASYKDWGKTSDGYFYMQTGGFSRLLEEKPDLITVEPHQDKPEFLSEMNLLYLDRLPATIEMMEATEVTDSSALLHFNLKDPGKNARVSVYWDKKDGLTYVKGNVGGGGVVQWACSDKINVDRAGIVTYRLEGLLPKTRYYYRIRVVNEEGETWSMDTQNFVTR